MRKPWATWLLLVLLACGEKSSAPLPETWSTLPSAWSFREADATEWMPAAVPGTVHTDLMRAGRIPDPYQGTSIDSVQWVGERHWHYRTTFEVPAQLLQREHVELVCEGLDTFAEVLVNDVLVGEADNMHRTWRFPVKHVVKTGANVVEVRFRPAVEEGLARLRAYGRSLPADNDQGEVKVAPFVRKAGVHFGWDFAPRLLTCGIWRPIGLRAWDAARIAHVGIEQQASDGQRHLRIDVALDGDAPARSRLHAWLDGEALADVPAGEVLKALVPDTGLWWPAGMGQQKLRELRVALLNDGVEVSHWQGRIGLRDIDLDRSPDSIGTAFTFVVNGQSLFALGANLVPPHQLLPLVGDSAWVALVAVMQEARMNMVRVWGGGVYPPEAFFDACDTAGILVWQDLMFANTMVPDDAAFVENVRQEVLEQVGRLRHRASLALWCGNNEVEVAWHNWGWQRTWEITPTDSLRMWKAYQRLFEDLMPAWIALLDQRSYTPTSPLSNWGNAEGLHHGDLHYWGVWHGDEPFEAFAHNVGRFVSEYGFQSYPAWETLLESASAEELAAGAPLWRQRQLSYKGDAAIERLAKRDLGPVRDRRDLVEKSQALQARAYAMAIAAHHGARPHCMGTLLWQLNDLWPGPSWSIIDHGGRRKPAFHAVREAHERALTQTRVGR